MRVYISFNRPLSIACLKKRCFCVPNSKMIYVYIDFLKEPERCNGNIIFIVCEEAGYKNVAAAYIRCDIWQKNLDLPQTCWRNGRQTTQKKRLVIFWLILRNRLFASQPVSNVRNSLLSHFKCINQNLIGSKFPFCSCFTHS